MNVAEYRTMCDLACTKAYELKSSAERSGRERLAEEWNEVIYTIIEDCIEQCGDFPSLIDSEV